MLTIPQAQQDQGCNASEDHQEKQNAPAAKSVHGDPQEDTGQGSCAAGQQGTQVEVRWAPATAHRLVAVANGMGNEAAGRVRKQRTVSDPHLQPSLVPAGSLGLHPAIPHPSCWPGSWLRHPGSLGEAQDKQIFPDVAVVEQGGEGKGGCCRERAVVLQVFGREELLEEKLRTQGLPTWMVGTLGEGGTATTMQRAPICVHMRYHL